MKQVKCNTEFNTHRIKRAYMQTKTLWRYRTKIIYEKHVSWAIWFRKDCAFN